MITNGALEPVASCGPHTAPRPPLSRVPGAIPLPPAAGTSAAAPPPGSRPAGTVQVTLCPPMPGPRFAGDNGWAV
ncbi:hypothetical protein CP971_00625 [Streptomyces viridifaciens]|nr:hypothetical protein CP971_00625 [Streptomyces viridifaciens]